MNQIKINITDIASSGHGTAQHHTYGLIHVLGTFPGDRVVANVHKIIGSMSYAEIISFLEYSSWRIHQPSTSPFFSANMPWEHLSDDAENNYKNNFVYSLYEKYLSENLKEDFFDENNTIKNTLPTTQYRNKVAYSFIKTGKKNDKIGFALYTRGSETTKKIEQENNPLVHPALEEAGKYFLQFFNSKNMTLKDIKYLILRYSYFENKVVAHILVSETNRKKIGFKKTDLEVFLKNKILISGVLVSHSEHGVRSAITTKDFYDIGTITLTEKVLNKTYIYHPSLFFQIYPAAFEVILSDLRGIIQNISNSKKLPVLDLFAGVGIIGLEIADLVDNVVGVELSALSKKYAQKNAQLNTIENFKFIQSSVDEVLNHIQDNQILIVDPTRAGLSAETLDAIIENKPLYIIYISCNPETQHADFEKIKDIYILEFTKAYNIFPKTHHVESMIVLKKKD